MDTLLLTTIILPDRLNRWREKGNTANEDVIKPLFERKKWLIDIFHKKEKIHSKRILSMDQ